jgi:hypothetical protein
VFPHSPFIPAKAGIELSPRLRGDVLLDDVFVPDAAIGARRKPGVWHPLMHIVSMVAFPLVYSVEIARSAIKTAELAREVAGGASYHRRNGLERLFRDVQGARFHPLPISSAGSPAVWRSACRSTDERYLALRTIRS